MMKRLLICLLLPFLLSPTRSVWAADGAQIFQGILGVLGSIEQAERQRQIQELQALEPAMNACVQGNINMCNYVLKSKALTPQHRAILEQARWRSLEQQKAQQREFLVYKANWKSCHKGILSACNAALGYVNANAHDKAVLFRKRHEIMQRNRQKTNLGISVDTGSWKPLNKEHFERAATPTYTNRNTQETIFLGLYIRVATSRILCSYFALYNARCVYLSLSRYWQ